MNSNNKIALSFLSLIPNDFNITLYRKMMDDGDTKFSYPNCSKRRLPIDNIKQQNDIKYYDYWVSWKPQVGFDKYSCTSTTNNYLTLELLYMLLLHNCNGRLPGDKYIIPGGFRNRMILFSIEEFIEGKQCVWMEPYYLSIAKTFGFLIDFKFYSSVPNFNRKIQRLSLSLDKDYKSNKNYYIDRYEKLFVFLDKYHKLIFPLDYEGFKLQVPKTLFQLDANELATKEYVFSKGNTEKSQFNGIKKFGPLNSPKAGSKIYFIFCEKDRPFSYDLFHALKGDSFKATFPGMEALFRFDFEKNVGGKTIQDYSVESLEKAIESIKEDSKNKSIIPLMLIPFKRGDGDEANEIYYKAKYTFLRHHLPSQFVSLKQMQFKDQLKWAVSNIGLQLFAKMGGIPWKVTPKTTNCLIVGIGQSHKKRNGLIEKYFAYSVLTESTGLYKELKILGQSTDKIKYISNLKKSLKSIFLQYYDSYDSFVIHATFSIKGEELEVIKNVCDELASTGKSTKEFVVIKFNDHNKYFAYSETNNSMVPFESTYIKLSDNEYLIWFEGVQYHNPNIFKRIERPLHVEFIYPTKDKSLIEEKKIMLIQDSINISGANWRGFNAKSLPVSIYYAYLVANYYKEFQYLGLDDIDFEEVNPWFL